MSALDSPEVKRPKMIKVCVLSTLIVFTTDMGSDNRDP